jgi:hypothetical protein
VVADLFGDEVGVILLVVLVDVGGDVVGEEDLAEEGVQGLFDGDGRGTGDVQLGTQGG